ncbi:hypothetical protein TorRG33x02_172960 [Trema orientale]|uniref:HTH three-helical bundle domain-containing protein n=1 Tax=Trema orientale TaxID=63057 RepID=A0A2P5EN35_TREOI|nr:hypothetical protein TorRG33x02_172960 [Trema orientale]
MAPFPFPCPRERIAASALLLLSTRPPSASSSSSSPMFRFEFKDDEEESIQEASKIKSWKGSIVSSDSKSCASSSRSDLSIEEDSDRSMRIFAFVPGRNEMRLKVLRKSRSKIHKSSNRWKFSSGESSVTSSASGSVSTEVSCLSSATACSADSSARSRHANFGKEKLSVARDELRRILGGGSAHIWRRADSILNMLSDGCYSEVRIRQVLGDSPDTSKALRMLLKLEEVKRSGTGGRQDPYIYKIASQYRK